MAMRDLLRSTAVRYGSGRLSMETVDKPIALAKIGLHDDLQIIENRLSDRASCRSIKSFAWDLLDQMHHPFTS
jgi:hypothetical protein